MSELMDAILTRRSVRSFKSELPPQEAIDQITLAGTYAASGMGKQSPIIITVTNPELLKKLEILNGEIAGRENPQFYGAPLLFIVLADSSVPTCVCDGSLVLGNMMLAAHDLGLGSCWIHRAKQSFEAPLGKQILASLGLEDRYVGVGNLAVGYIEGEAPAAKPRKDGRVFQID